MSPVCGIFTYPGHFSELMFRNVLQLKDDIYIRQLENRVWGSIMKQNLAKNLAAMGSLFSIRVKCRQNVCCEVRRFLIAAPGSCTTNQLTN